MSGLNECTRELLRSVPGAGANRRFHSGLAALGWYRSRAVYCETCWLREVPSGDSDLTTRLRRLLTPGTLDLDAQCAALPPADHVTD